jgi:hypothetical protein
MRRWCAAEKEGEWVKYSISKQGWIEESKRLERNPLWTIRPTLWYPSRSGTHLLRPRPSGDQVCYQDGRQVPETIVPGQVLTPLWQVIPAAASAVNVNVLSDERLVDLYTAMRATNQYLHAMHTEIGDLLDSLFDPNVKSIELNPHAFLIMEPVYSAFDESPEHDCFHKLMHTVQLEAYEAIVQDCHLNCVRSKQKKTTTYFSPGQYMDQYQYQSYSNLGSASLRSYRYNSTTTLPQLLLLPTHSYYYERKLNPQPSTNKSKHFHCRPRDSHRDLPRYHLITGKA